MIGMVLALALPLTVHARKEQVQLAAEETLLMVASMKGLGSQLCWVNRDGTIQRKLPLSGSCFDVKQLTGGQFLITYRTKVIRMDQTGKELWSYVATKGGEIMNAWVKANGTTEIGMCHPGGPRVITADTQGQKVGELIMEVSEGGPHGQTRKIIPVGDDIFLYCPMFGREREIREIDRDGAIRKRFKLSGGYVFDMQRLANGNTLLGCGSGRRVVEIDGDGKTIWETTKDDLGKVKVLFVSSVERLPNGNTLFCNLRIHVEKEKDLPPQPLVVEVTPDKKVAWQLGPRDDITGVFWARLLRTNPDIQ